MARIGRTIVLFSVSWFSLLAANAVLRIAGPTNLPHTSGMQDPHCQLDPCILRDRLHSAESLLGGVITLTGLAKITEIQTRALSESCPSSSYYQMGQDYALSWLGFDTPLREFGGFALRKSGCLGLNGDVRRDYLLGILDGTSRFRAQSNLAYIR